MPEESKQQVSVPTGSALRTRLFARYRFLPFVLPFVVFMLLGLLEPSLPNVTGEVVPSSVPSSADAVAENAVREPDEAQHLLSYPLANMMRILLTGAAVLFVLPSWREIPWRCSWWAVAAGLIGGVMWIALCRLKIEDHALVLVGLGHWTTLGDRAAFDPFAALGTVPTWMVLFLAVRLTGLVVIVPLVEEFFLRGFLMRFVEKPDWWTIELGTVTKMGAGVVVLYAVLSHPAEIIAAALWFSLITLLYSRTRSIWDCVVAHAVTNAMLGVFILLFRDWTLW